MNIQQIMKQAQQMQRKLQENQAILEKKEFEGNASNGYVKIVMEIQKNIRKITELVVQHHLK